MKKTTLCLTMVSGLSFLVPETVFATVNSQPVTVTVAFDGAEISQGDINYFNKTHAGIKIKYIDINQGGKLQALLASGNAPDIIRITASNELGNYVTKGIAMDLQPYFAKSTAFKKSDFLPPVASWRWDGKNQGSGDLYGFPKDDAPDQALWYNKKLFQAAHVALPSSTQPMTWTQVLNLAKKLTIIKNGKVAQYGLGYAEGLTEANQNLVIGPAAQVGQSLWSSDYRKAKFESPKVEKILQMWANGVAGDIGPNSVNTDPNWSGNLFQDGKMALFITGYWYSAQLKAASISSSHLTDFVLVPGPVMPGGKRMDPTDSNTGGIIYSKTKHPDQAWTVFEYLFAGKAANNRAGEGWGFPVLRSKLKYLPLKTPWERSIYHSTLDETKYMYPVLRYNPFLSGSAVDTVIKKYMVPVYYHRDTVAGAAQKIDRDLDSLIQSGMIDAGVQ